MEHEAPFAVVNNYQGDLPIYVYVCSSGGSHYNKQIRQFTVCPTGSSAKIPYPSEYTTAVKNANLNTVMYRISDFENKSASSFTLNYDPQPQPAFCVYKTSFQGDTSSDLKAGYKRSKVCVRGAEDVVFYRDEVFTYGGTMAVTLAELWEGDPNDVHNTDRIIIWITLRYQKSYLNSSSRGSEPFCPEIPQFILIMDHRLHTGRNIPTPDIQHSMSPYNRCANLDLKNKLRHLMVIDMEIINPLNSGLRILDNKQTVTGKLTQLTKDQRLYIQWTQIHTDQPLLTKTSFQIYQTSAKQSEPLCYLFVEATWDVADFSPRVQYSFNSINDAGNATKRIKTDKGKSLEMHIPINKTTGLRRHVIVAALAWG